MNKNKVQILVEGAAMIALATVLSYIRFIKLPWGGSITLLSMLPIVIFSVRRGIAAGLSVSFVFSLIQFFQGVGDGLFGWGLTPGILIACILLDYIVAFSVLGLAGLFRKGGVVGSSCGVFLAVFLRFVSHILSGYYIWRGVGQLWDGFFVSKPLLYSFAYNGAYMLPEMVLTTLATVILFSVPATRKLLLNPTE